MSLLIHEVAKLTGLHIDTLRRLERRGLISPKRDVNGWRRYAPEIVEMLRGLYLKNPVKTPATSSKREEESAP